MENSNLKKTTICGLQQTTKPLYAVTKMHQTDDTPILTFY